MKALLICSAHQYPFAGGFDRHKQGWGCPALLRLWDNRDRIFVVDESSPVMAGATDTYKVTVDAGEPVLKVTLVYRDPAKTSALVSDAATSSDGFVARINDLDLRVTSPDGQSLYWGNNGLLNGLWSSTGGQADDRNTVENVFVQSPAAGEWTVEVIGSEITEDVTPQTDDHDAPYALVVMGISSAGISTEFKHEPYPERIYCVPGWWWCVGERHELNGRQGTRWFHTRRGWCGVPLRLQGSDDAYWYYSQRGGRVWAYAKRSVRGCSFIRCGLRRPDGTRWMRARRALTCHKGPE